MGEKWGATWEPKLGESGVCLRQARGWTHIRSTQRAAIPRATARQDSSFSSCKPFISWVLMFPQKPSAGGGDRQM